MKNSFHSGIQLDTLSPYSTSCALLAQFQKGIGVSTGVVLPDQRACKCGEGSWSKVKFGKKYLYQCSACKEEPTLFRVRKYFPKIGKKDLRYDHFKNRFRDINAAFGFLATIEGEIKGGDFDLTKYETKKGANTGLFEVFVEKIYLPHYEMLQESGTYKPSSMAAKRQYLRNHLLPLFTGKYLNDFHDGTIDVMYAKLKCSDRMKDLVAQELRTMLNFAKKHKYLKVEVPNFPAMRKAPLQDAEILLTVPEQLKVIDHIDDEQYKMMIQIMCHLGIRPSEVRALKWSDWDFRKGLLYIRRHVTLKNIVIPGRKSNGDSHTVAIAPELRAIISSLPWPIGELQDSYMFPGKENEIVSQGCLSRAWAKAIKLAGITYVDLYRGAKSSRLSQLLRDGHPVEHIAILVGISVEAVKRYAQHNNESIKKMQLRMLGGV